MLILTSGSGGVSACVTVKAKYSNTSVSKCINLGQPPTIIDIGTLQLTYSPDILQVEETSGYPVYFVPSQVQVTTSDANSTVYFGIFYTPTNGGLWSLAFPAPTIRVFKGLVTIPNVFPLANISNSEITITPKAHVTSGKFISIEPSSVTLQPGHAVSFTATVDLTDVPVNLSTVENNPPQLVLDSPTVLNPQYPGSPGEVGIAPGAIIIGYGGPQPPQQAVVALDLWSLPSTNMAFPATETLAPELVFPGLSSQDVNNILTYCMIAGANGYETNNWMQQPLPVCIVPQTTSDSLTISTSPGFITIPLSLSQAYVPGNYIPPAGFQLPPSSGTPPVVVKPGINVVIYLMYAVRAGCTGQITIPGGNSYYTELKYSVVGQQSGKVYASGDVRGGPYNNCNGSYEVYNVTFTMPNEPVVLEATAYATKPAEDVIGMPNVFPLKLGSVTAQFVPMQCQPYDNYGSVATAVVMLPTTGVFKYLTDVKYWECTNPSCVNPRLRICFSYHHLHQL